MRNKLNALSRRQTYALIAAALLLIGLTVTFILHAHTVAERNARRALLPKLLPTVTRHELGASRSFTLFTPKNSLMTLVIAVPSGTELDTKTLRKLSYDASATLVELQLPSTDCQQADVDLDAQLAKFGLTANVVVGINEQRSLARQWLSAQTSDKAIAASFNAGNPGAASSVLCAESEVAPDPRWHDLTAHDVTDETQTSKNALPTNEHLSLHLDNTLRSLLNITTPECFNHFPLSELPAQPTGDTLAIFYSGDGGWRGFDDKVSARLATSGLSVVGMDALQYFWNTKPVSTGASDLSSIMKHYRQAWGIKHFILIGFSFGADVLPAYYNQLPTADKDDISHIILLSLARHANFEIHIEGIMGQEVGTHATGPEVAKLPAAKVTCIYGTEEANKSGCTDTTVVGRVVALPGTHHFNDDIELVSTQLLHSIRRPAP